MIWVGGMESLTEYKNNRKSGDSLNTFSLIEERIFIESSTIEIFHDKVMLLLSSSLSRRVCGFVR